jgi:hypothetical protein
MGQENQIVDEPRELVSFGCSWQSTNQVEMIGWFADREIEIKKEELRGDLGSRKD